MRKWYACVTLVLLVFSIVGTAAHASDGTRIALNKDDALLAGLTIRHELLNNRVSAHVSDAELLSLQEKGISYDLVGQASVSPLEVSDVDAEKKAESTDSSLRVLLPYSQVPYGIKMIYGDPNLTPSSVKGGTGVIVAVLDTGSVDHPDFTRKDGTNVITGCVDFSNLVVPQVEGYCLDGHSHGTHVIGTVAAAGGSDGQGIFGVAPGASVYSYKVLTDTGFGFFDDVARGIIVAADRGAHIISMSLGGSRGNKDLENAIRYAVNKGVLVVAAAGNDGPEANTIGFPAAYADAVAVAALNPTEVVAYFSSRGVDDGNDAVISFREVEVSGPGRSTLSTFVTGGYIRFSGTSMATPHIAGLAAKMWKGSGSKTRSWLQAQAQQHDITTAEDINNAGPGYDIASGYGLPQVKSLVQARWYD